MSRSVKAYYFRYIVAKILRFGFLRKAFLFSSFYWWLVDRLRKQKRNISLGENSFIHLSLLTLQFTFTLIKRNILKLIQIFALCGSGKMRAKIMKIFAQKNGEGKITSKICCYGKFSAFFTHKLFLSSPLLIPYGTVLPSHLVSYVKNSSLPFYVQCDAWGRLLKFSNNDM